MLTLRPTAMYRTLPDPTSQAVLKARPSCEVNCSHSFKSKLFSRVAGFRAQPAALWSLAGLHVVANSDGLATELFES